MYEGILLFDVRALGTIQILHKHLEWVCGVSQMLMLYAKSVLVTNEVCLQGGWVGQEMVQNMLTKYLNGPLVAVLQPIQDFHCLSSSK